MNDPSVGTHGVRAVHLYGASGFVGRHVRRSLEAHGLDVVAREAPRLRCGARLTDDIIAAIDDDLVAQVRSQLRPGDVVVNSAGLVPGTGDQDALAGANALLPAVLARAVATSGSGSRLVHLSSAAVQGSEPVLTAAGPLRPFNDYSVLKALGERAVLQVAAGAVSCLRPASVHGRERRVTQALVRFACSGASTTLAPGSAATPQHHVENVAAAVRHLVLAITPPPVVLQPDEGFTTSGFLTLMSGGRRPRLAPRSLGPFVTHARVAASRHLPAAAQQLRRLELLLRGQEQEPSWLMGDGFIPPSGRTAWIEMAGDLRAGAGSRP